MTRAEEMLKAGEMIHGKLERVLTAKRHWRAIARALGFSKKAIRLLAKTRKPNGLIWYECDYGFDGRVDFVQIGRSAHPEIL